MKIVLPALARPLLERRLPAGHDVRWFANSGEARDMIAEADIAWVDQMRPQATAEIVAKGVTLKWLSTIYAGLDALDLAQLAERGTIVTNGTGINAVAVAEYAVMGMLVAAKRFDAVVRLADGHQWTTEAPGRIELFETSALVIGYGTIGRLIGDRLAAFGVAVTGVTRSGRDGTLTPDQWRERLGRFDWIVLASPATDDTRAMIGADELAMMKRSAWLINIARGGTVDQEALIAALAARHIAGAFLDTVEPEPLPPDHPLWKTPNVIHSMHLSGRSQNGMIARGVALFLDNLDAHLNGREMRNVVDLHRGY